jgi:hypothetical protein
MSGEAKREEIIGEWDMGEGIIGFCKSCRMILGFLAVFA